MSMSVLFGLILLVVAGGAGIVATLTGNLATSIPAPPPLDSYDVDAEHRARIVAMFASKP